MINFKNIPEEALDYIKECVPINLSSFFHWENFNHKFPKVPFASFQKAFDKFRKDYFNSSISLKKSQKIKKESKREKEGIRGSSNSTLKKLKSSKELVIFSDQSPMDIEICQKKYTIEATPTKYEFFLINNLELGFPLIYKFCYSMKFVFQIPKYGVLIINPGIYNGKKVDPQLLKIKGYPEDEYYFGFKYHMMIPQKNQLANVMSQEDLSKWDDGHKYSILKKMVIPLGFHHVLQSETANMQLYNHVERLLTNDTIEFTLSVVTVVEPTL
ncbi:hypothetical protein DICPUDRAFT_74981 [Dictyostelium purpureum]|uniref:Uncharacterized protein n=1 Tax=Dictyostelium purpureum TaxID=5786 RepID=F0Z9A7_DICPU|nr:uncharacterized protein DICPUDRAFT_74981 [Dictyostelium purpureum]EGC39467.1 hypothetical protein DICPUDRAFT_74981 [Dictyostelium purpureum]|eukprot:XP_003284025.1 hypothetical protein DICPUDRAFT_74981 [Dictyostelium purpureum]